MPRQISAISIICLREAARLASSSGWRPDEIVLETVRRDQIDLLAEQVLALFGRQIADRREAVVVRCGRLFERVLRDYAEPAGQVVGVQLGHGRRTGACRCRLCCDP